MKRTSRKRGSSRRTSRRPARRVSRNPIYVVANTNTSSGKKIPRASSVIYTEKSKFPKWNIKPSATQEPRLLLPRLRTWTKQDHLDAARWHRRVANRIAKQIHAKMASGEKQYGTSGGLISGGFYGSWPESAKEQLRKLNHMYNFAADASEAHAKIAKSRSVLKANRLKRRSR
jgi:hypothetical protein